MMFSTSSNFVRHRTCNHSPSQSGKDDETTVRRMLPSSSSLNSSRNNILGFVSGDGDDDNSNIVRTLNGGVSSNTDNLQNNKLHGRRSQLLKLPRWKSKTTLVLGVALTIPSLCLLGMYMSSTSMDSLNINSSPHFRHNDVSRKTRLGKEHLRLRNHEEIEKGDEMELFARKKRRRKHNDYDPFTVGHNDEEEEEEEEYDEGRSIDDDNVHGDEEEEEQSSSHKEEGTIVNSQQKQFRYSPRVLRLELKKQFPHKKIGGGGGGGGDDSSNSNSSRGGKPKLSHSDVLLKAVHRLPIHESRDILPSERYITPYPDDDGYIDRLESVKKSKKYRNNEREALEDDACQAKHAWQAGAYPNCNILHEYELGQLTGMFGRAMRKKLRKNEGDGDELVKYLASGYWRDVWLLSKASGSFVDGSSTINITTKNMSTNFLENVLTLSKNDTSSSSSVLSDEEITVLKTLRFRHDFTDRNYDRHRKDALASMRMSQSPNVVDIYAYCSNSAVFEYGKGGDIDAKLWPYDKEAGKYYVADIPSLEKVDIAYQVARAIADLHDVEVDGHASIAHTDITPSQFIFINGRWKLNDFNRCRFMRVRKIDGAPCGFYVGANPGKFRAPEEYAFLEENEMVDIYSMGNIFYSILSGNMPFEGQKESKAQKKVLDGVRPKIPDEVKESEDIAIQKLISITKKCWSKKAKDRPSAASIRDELKDLIDRITTRTNATTIGEK